MANHYYFVSYVEASEKPFTSNQIESTIVKIDSGEVDCEYSEFLDEIRREISFDWRNVVIISLSVMDFKKD